MEVLHHKKNHRDLLAYLPRLKMTLQEWLFVDVRLLVGKAAEDFTVANVAERLHAIFADREGTVYICNDCEILMLLHWNKNNALSEISRKIERQMPDGSCEIHVSEPTPEGLARLEILITYKKPAVDSTFANTRSMRRENVILVADDDMYIRLLVKKGIPGTATVYEVGNGSEVMDAYKKYVPDVLFLDIHMPNQDGTDVMRDILAIDPQAYIVMLSADSTQENVQLTTHQGAKGFLTKPFSKEKLQDYVRKCPTFLL